MSVQRSYNSWSATYDSVENKTRDLEKLACRQILSDVSFETVIELGGGTGKNTEWLAENAKHVTAVDLSEAMQAVAKEKIKSGNVGFKQADVKKPWDFSDSKADLITCSLILEHVEDLDFIFQQAAQHLNPSGRFYICELHPFKQYGGTKARFESDDGPQIVECYTHNLSDYFNAAEKAELSLVHLDEWFDDNDRTTIPRLVSFLFSVS
jgi:ubiquinone/menaquinone biosynthesis C-methylase UbiE